MEAERRELETFRRLHHLIDRGYVPQLGSVHGDDAIHLNHLGAGPRLILYADGLLVGLDERPLHDGHNPDRIWNNGQLDAAAFDRFTGRVVKPSWWQRGAPARDRYLVNPGCTVLILLTLLGIGRLLEATWKAAWG